MVLPIAITGADKILHSHSFTFELTDGSMTLGEPIFVGPADAAPRDIINLDADSLARETRKQEAMDTIGRKVAAMLPEDMRGAYASAP